MGSGHGSTPGSVDSEASLFKVGDQNQTDLCHFPNQICLADAHDPTPRPNCLVKRFILLTFAIFTIDNIFYQ